MQFVGAFPYVLALLAGAFGGVIGGALVRRCSLGVAENALIGVIGGIFSRQFAGFLIAKSAIQSTAWAEVASLLASGFACGGALLLIVGYARYRSRAF